MNLNLKICKFNRMASISFYEHYFHKIIAMAKKGREIIAMSKNWIKIIVISISRRKII